MHVPDGFLAPSTWVPATAVSVGLWSASARRLVHGLDPALLPRVGVLTAVAFVLMMLSVPLPGGSTAHFTGVALLAIVFGVGTAFFCVSLVLLLQAALLGAGGMTTWGLSALVVGGVGALLARLCWRLLRTTSRRAAVFLAAWVSVVASAAVMALVLGGQPALAHDAQGRPSYFPFGWSVVIPALVLPHVLVGVGEGLLTVMMVEAYQRATGSEVS